LCPPMLVPGMILRLSASHSCDACPALYAGHPALMLLPAE